MKKNKLLSLFITVLLLTSLVACTPADPTKSVESKAPEASSAEEASKGSDVEDIKIGYAINTLSHEWYQNIAQGSERRAEEIGGIELTVMGAEMDSATQISQIENMITDGVQCIIMSPVDYLALPGAVAEAKKAGIPVITESNYVEGADVYVGIDNVASAKEAGLWYAELATEKGIVPKILIAGFPEYNDCRQRVEGFKAGLEESGIEYEIVQEVNTKGEKTTALQVAADALTAHPEVNCIFGINDNSATGAMNAYIEAGLDQSALTVIGFGFEGVAGRDALLGDTPYQAAVAMFPDYVGATLIDTALKIIAGEDVPKEVITTTLLMTEDVFAQYYTKNADGTYTTNFASIDAYAAASK